MEQDVYVAESPVVLVVEGKAKEEGKMIVGEANFRGAELPFYLNNPFLGKCRLDAALAAARDGLKSGSDREIIKDGRVLIIIIIKYSNQVWRVSKRRRRVRRSSDGS